MFSKQEIAFVKQQRLARFATVSKTLQPDVAPVVFDFDGKNFYVAGLDLAQTFKFKNVTGGNRRVAFVLDDLETIEPWRPRGIKIHGTADIVTRKGRFGRRTYMRIKPHTMWSWGIKEPA